MFSSPSKLRERPCVLTLCGLEGSGKTSFVKLLVTGQITESVPTLRNRLVSASFTTCSEPKRSVSIKLMDCSGDKTWGRKWNLGLGSGVLFFVDGSNREKLHEAKQELAKVIISLARKEDIHQISRRCAVILNKSDLLTFCPYNDLLHALELDEETALASPNIKVFECSVYRNEGFTQALEWVVFNHA